MSQTDQTRAGVQSRWKLTLLVLLVNIAILVAIECAARVVSTVKKDLAANPGRPAADAEWFEYSSDVGWQPRPSYSGEVAGFRAYDSQGYLRIDSSQVGPRNAGRYRIVFIGDSNTMGYELAAEDAFPEVLDQLLPNVEVVNLGRVGYSSYQGLVLLRKKIAALKPDIVVASFNCNDRRLVSSESLQDGADRFERLFDATGSAPLGLAASLNASYAVSAFQKLLRSAGLLPAERRSFRLDSLPVRVPPRDYRNNLVEISKVARGHNALPVFLLLGDNPIMTSQLREGVALRKDGNLLLSISYLRSAAEARGTFGSLARLELSRAYMAANDSSHAAEARVTELFESTLHGLGPLFLDTDYHDLMRSAAAETDSPVIDGAELLSAHPEWYTDGCHFNRDGHQLLARKLADELEPLLAVRETATQRQP